MISPPIDDAQAQRFLRALCETPDTDPTIVFQCTDDAKRDRPGYTEARAGTLPALLGYLHAQNLRGAAVFFQVNAGGRGDALVTAPRALFLDDDLTAEARPDLSALPPSAIVRSSTAPDGRAKTHYYWFLKEDEPLEAYTPAMTTLARVFGTDESMSDPGQCMRLPGFLHCKGAPQRSELLSCDETRRFTIAEVLAAFPVKGAQGAPTVPVRAPITLPVLASARKTLLAALRSGEPTSTANTAEGATDASATRDYNHVDAALAGDLPPPTAPGTDGKDSDEAAHTEKSEATFHRVVAWLKRIGEPFVVKVQKPRFIYLTGGCPRNRDHKDAVIIVKRTGGITAKCFHSSCGGNGPSWRDFRDILGGWAELVRGDHVELATRLRNELRTAYKTDLVAESRHKLALVYRYDAATGVWVVLSDEVITDQIMAYAGLTYGSRGSLLRLDASDVHGVLNLFKERCSQPLFFKDAPDGALFTNGFLTVEKRELKLLPHAPENRVRASYPFAYEASADAPRWRQFLREIFEKDEDAEQKITFLQEFFGACLLGVATRYHITPFLTGGGSNGKSVTLRIISALFPPDLITSVRPQDMDNDYHRALLQRARINIVTETPEREIIQTSGFKAIIDGSRMTARQIFKEVTTFVPTAGNVFACNTLPATTDFTDGFWRRIAVICFNRKFLEHERDEMLAETIIENELAGVCNWALAGGARLLTRGRYLEPPSSVEAKAAWRWQANPVARFIEEACEPCEATDGTITEVLYQAYRAWSEENGHKGILAKVAFAVRLENLQVSHRRGKVERKARTIWQLTLTNDYAQLVS